MEKAGDIYLAGYQGWYSVRDEAFYAESETVLGANGIRLGPQGTPVEWTEEQTYFFRLSKYEKKLLKLYEENPDFILPPERRNEIVSFVKGGLQDLSISRTTLDWGIPVPGAPGHIIYVWVDALTNYITASGFPKIRAKSWKERWPAQLHVIGKDITRFHAVYWPAFLMSAKIALPERIFSHGFLYNKGEKMSKSVGNVIAPLDMANTYGADQIRYFFLREVPFGQDGSSLTRSIRELRERGFGERSWQSRAALALHDRQAMREQNSGAWAIHPCRRRNARQPHGRSFLCAARRWTGRRSTNPSRRSGTPSPKRTAISRARDPWAHKKSYPVRMGTILYITAEAGPPRGDLELAVCTGSGLEIPRSARHPRSGAGFCGPRAGKDDTA